jgi:hypothetical protein
MFSIQDKNDNDVRNILTMAEIYAADTGKRMKVYPWTIQKIGDFELDYTFPRNGNYQVVISVANTPTYAASKSGIIDPPRDTLSSHENNNGNGAHYKRRQKTTRIYCIS